MKPLGRVPVRFPSKEDCHPPKGYVNWWEAEVDTSSKARYRRETAKEVNEYLNESLSNDDHSRTN
jgi:hypothetical protein